MGLEEVAFDMTDKNMLVQELRAVCMDLISRKEELCRLDSYVGDGDHGISIHKGFSRILTALETPAGTLEGIFTQCSDAILDSMGGAIGPIFASVFIGFAMASRGKELLSAEDWRRNFEKALEVVENTGEAKPGDRTLVDTLASVVEAFGDGAVPEQLWANAEKRAHEGAESTKNMLAKRGRASYLGDKSLGHVDAGAMSMYYFIRQIAEFEMGNLISI